MAPARERFVGWRDTLRQIGTEDPKYRSEKYQRLICEVLIYLAEQVSGEEE